MGVLIYEISTIYSKWILFDKGIFSSNTDIFVSSWRKYVNMQKRPRPLWHKFACTCPLLISCLVVKVFTVIGGRAFKTLEELWILSSAKSVHDWVNKIFQISLFTLGADLYLYIALSHHYQGGISARLHRLSANWMAGQWIMKDRRWSINRLLRWVTD